MSSFPWTFAAGLYLLSEFPHRLHFNRKWRLTINRGALYGRGGGGGGGKRADPPINKRITHGSVAARKELGAAADWPKWRLNRHAPYWIATNVWEGVCRYLREVSRSICGIFTCSEVDRSSRDKLFFLSGFWLWAGDEKCSKLLKLCSINQQKIKFSISTI